MSVVAGVLDAHGRPPRADEVDRMLRAMAHGRPPGRRSWTGEGVALAVAPGPEPASGGMDARPAPQAGHLVLSGDLRVDNRDTLAAALGPSDDAALLLAAYERWGDGCVDHLVGDFAFAIWDVAQRRLFCARDHFGTRPFYYAWDNGRLVFASQIKGVRAAMASPPPADGRRVADFLAALPPPADATFYAGVHRLPPGCALVVERGRMHSRSYWTLQAGEIRARKDAAEEFRSIFTEAVACRTRDARAAGALLSGGLDSSSIACVAADLATAEGAGPFPTISLVFDETPQWSERPQIETVLARGGLSPTFVTGVSPFADFESVLDDQDGLTNAPAIGVTRNITKSAAELGLDVVLDGHGGDEVVSYGAGRLAELAKAKAWRSLWRETRGVGQLFGESPLGMFGSYVFHYAKGAHLRRRLIRRFSSASARADAYASLVAAPFAEATELAARAAAHHRPLPQDEQGQHLRTLTDDIQSYGLESLDRSSSAVGVRTCYPFWDKRLVEFCLNLESSEKLGGGWTRLILRRAMEGVLPPAIQWRRDKLDFSPHLSLGMLGPDGPVLEAMIAHDEADIGAYVSLPVLREAYARLRAGRERTNGGDVQTVWRGVAFALWLRKARSDGLAIA